MKTPKNPEVQNIFHRLKMVSGNTSPKPKIKNTRFEEPVLPTGPLKNQDKWKALLWNIKTAKAHGPRALQSMVIALTKTIQAEILRDMFFDLRHGSSEHYDIPDLLWDIDLPIREDGASIRTLLRKRRTIPKVNLSHASVIPQPWERWRLARSFQNLGKDAPWGEWRDNSNIFAIAWTPWPIFWVNNGNHSTMAAIVTHGGLLQASETYDATNLLKSIYTDGLNWIRVDNDAVIAPVKSLAMAAIFEIGKEMISRKFKKPVNDTLKSSK